MDLEVFSQCNNYSTVEVHLWSSWYLIPISGMICAYSMIILCG